MNQLPAIPPLATQPTHSNLEPELTPIPPQPSPYKGEGAEQVVQPPPASPQAPVSPLTKGGLRGGNAGSQSSPLVGPRTSNLGFSEPTFLDQVDVDLQHICTNPTQLDQDPTALRTAFTALGVRSLLGLKGPKSWGGAQLPAMLFYQFQEKVAQHSGALAFLQTQHQSAVAKLARCGNDDLKQRYLTAAIQGRIGVGVGFSHLRRRGNPVVKAIPVTGGYRISGQVPWITGYGCFQVFILAATLPDQRVLFGLLPLKSQTQTNNSDASPNETESLGLSAPLGLAAMMSTQTVKAELHNYFLPESEVLDIQPEDWIHRSDRRNTLNHSFFALGCARAGLNVLAQAMARPGAAPAIQDTWIVLDKQLNRCRAHIYQAQASVLDHKAGENRTDGDGVGDRLKLRATAIDLAVRCAHSAVISSRGGAIALDHPAQRIFREAMAFSVFGQTTAVMTASLGALSLGALREPKSFCDDPQV